METYDHNDANISLISISINNRLIHFEHLTKSVMIIQSVFDNVEIGDILRF